jgi:CheY-like chemotaxis protein
MANLLVLDSDPHVRHLIALMLRQSGYRVEVLSPSAQLDPVQFGQIDLIICEVENLESADLARIADLRHLFPDAKIIAISAGLCGNKPDELVKAPDDVGLDGVLGKPFSIQALLNIVSEVLR